MAQKTVETPPKDFLTDDEMQALSKSDTPDFISDEDMAKMSQVPPTPETWSSGLARIIHGAGQEFGIDPKRPITSAISSTASGLYNLGKSIIKPDNPLGAAGNIASGLYHEGRDIVGQYSQGFAENDPAKLQTAFGRTLGLGLALGGGALAAEKAAPLLESVPESISARLAYRKAAPNQPLLFDTPVNRMRTGLGIKGMTDADIVKAGNELKAAEVEHGPIAHVDKALDATDSRVTLYNQANKRLLTPYNGLPVPGSRAAIVNAEIAAVPDSLRLGDPAKYAKVIKDIQTKHADLPDYTVGDLNDMRVSANKQLRQFYSKNKLAQMTQEEQMHTATIEAQGNTARGLIYNRLPSNISEAFAENNSRIGAISKLQQNLYGAVDTAREQSATPSLSLGRAMSALKTKGASLLAPSNTINSDLANAMRRWQGTNGPVTLGPAPPFHPMNAITNPSRLLEQGLPLPTGEGIPASPHQQPYANMDPNLLEPRSPSSLSAPSSGAPPVNAPTSLGPHPSTAPGAALSGSPQPIGKLRFSHTEYVGGKPMPVWVDEAGRTFRY